MVCALLWAAQDSGRLKDMLKKLKGEGQRGAFQGLSSNEEVLLYHLPSTAYCLQSMIVILTLLCCWAQLGVDHCHAIDRLAVTCWSRCCSHMFGSLS